MSYGHEGMIRSARRLVVTAGFLGFTITSGCSLALAQEEVVQPPAKIAGLPIGIIEEAFSNPDPVARQRMFSLLAQRIVRNTAARQRLMNTDSTEIASRLARFQYAAQMLETAKGQTTNTAVRDKLTQVISAITAAQATTP